MTGGQISALVLMATSAVAGAALADEEEKRTDGIPTPSIATSLPNNGDPSGARAALAARGITGGANYTGEVIGNSSGGLKRSASYFGLLEVTTTIDFEKLAGWKGLTFFANGYQIHGHGITTNNLGPNLHTVSDIEATPATRLDEIWFEQKWMGDKVTLRVGQLAADTEFFLSDTATPTVNSSFGWPSIFAFGLPAGANAYPLTSLGARLKVEMNDSLTGLLAVYNGNPAGSRCVGDPQRCNDHGLEFRLGDSAFAIAELQFKYNQDKGATGLPGVVKVGAWHHFDDFNDLRYDTNGVRLADPGSNLVPRKRDGNSSVYGIVDQRLYNGQGSEAVNGFVRAAFAPGDRNLIDAYFDAGLSFTGFIPKRPDDSIIAAFAYSQISRGARSADRDAVAAGTQSIVRDGESLIELTYIAKILPGLTLQPDFQYVFHPAGKIDDGTGKPAGDAAVWALRTIINY